MTERNDASGDNLSVGSDLASFDRREVIVGLAAGAVVATSPARSQESPSSAKPDIRFVRNPDRHNEFGVAIDLTPPAVADRIALVFYPRTFGGTKLPEGYSNGAKAYHNLDRFAFDDVTLSERETYRIEFSVEYGVDDEKWMISAKFNRRGQRHSASSRVALADFATGRDGVLFVLNMTQAELFRWDMFGERIEVKGNDGAKLTLKLAPPAPVSRQQSPWIEPSLSLTLEPNKKSTIWALNSALIIQKLDIKKTDGDQGDGARIQEDQELGGFERTPTGRKGAYRAAAWIGEATDLKWGPSADKTANGLRYYAIGNTTAPREKPALEIALRENPTRLTLRQWGKARNTLVLLRSPLKTTLLSPTSAKTETLPKVEFHLVDAILTKQDTFDEAKNRISAVKPGDRKNENIVLTLAGRLQDKPFVVETAFGSFIVEGDPAPKRPKSETAAVENPRTKEAKKDRQDEGRKQDGSSNPLGRKLERLEDFAIRPAKGLTQFHLTAEQNTIRSFDVRALLRQISIALPNERKRGKDELQIVSETTKVWSRLDFSGTEIAFRLPLPDQPAQRWPSARGIVTLGEEPRDLVPLTKPLPKTEDVGKPFPPVSVSIALDGADLKVRRDSDNLALRFQFARMALQLGKGQARIVPNMLLSGGGAGKTAPIGSVRHSFDDRPLLIVHFPPQHVAEKAYYRQINDGVELPDVPSSMLGDLKFIRDLDTWRRMPIDDSKKLELRGRIFKEEEEEIARIQAQIKENKNDKSKKVDVKYEAIAERLDRGGIFKLLGLLNSEGKEDNWKDKVGDQADSLLPRWNALPQDQRAFYLGTSARAMDPDARKVWLDIWRAYLKANPLTAAAPQIDSFAFEEALLQLPDIDVPESVQDDIKLRLPEHNGSDAQKDRRGKTFNPVAFQSMLAAEKQKRSDDVRNVSKLYKDFADRGKEPGSPFPASLPLFYSGIEAIRNAWKTQVAAGESGKTEKGRVEAFVQLLATQFRTDYGQDDFRTITPARLSGPSRLVFRFDSAGGSFDDRDREKRSELGEEVELVRSIDFSFEGLTDWGRFDLAVTRRAETLEMFPGGRVPHPDMRAIDLDPARILAHQGIAPGRSIEGRLSDIRESLRRPDENQTAIELPFRLLLSPDQFGRFRTRRPTVQNVLREAPANGAPMAPVLWSANLQIGDASPVVRAVWSDDLRPGVFGGNETAPVRGPHAPWEVPKKGAANAREFRTALDAYDRHEIVALSSVYGLPVMGRRNELDNLVDASQFEPPPGYKLDNLKLYTRTSADKLDDLSGIYNPASLDVTELRLTALGGSLRHDSAFIPPASAVRADSKTDRLRNNNLFDAFSIERWRQITVLGRDIEVEVVYKGFLFPLGVRASLIKLTERRFMRHPQTKAFTAYLIQRKFIRIGKPTKDFPAVGQPDRSRRFPLSQLTMLTRETPDIVDPDLVVRNLELASLKTTPDITFGVRPNGKVDFSKSKDYKLDDLLSGLCFWPRTRPGRDGNIAFEFKIDGEATPQRVPLLFVDNVAANKPDVMAALATYYNWDRMADGSIPKEDADANGRDNLTNENRSLRTVTMGSARRRYADENQDGECQFETIRWEIKAEGRKELRRVEQLAGTPPPQLPSDEKFGNTLFEFDPLLQGSDQPPFYPFVAWAHVRVGQAERFIGRSLDPRDVRFDDDYTVVGFPTAADENSQNALERYLQLRNLLPLDMGEAGDRSGGIGRPAMDVKYLSRRYGLMPDGPVLPAPPVTAPPSPTLSPAGPDAGTPGTSTATDDADPPPPPPPPPFDLKSFFSGEAKLLGILTFQELLTLAAGSAIPELKEKVDAATEETAEFLRQSVLPQVGRALKSLEEMWSNAQKALTSQAGATRDVASLDINKIYPDIAPALVGLIDKVKRAEKASNLELVGAMSEVQAGGRKLVTAISRTLSDPMTPLREELRSKFRVMSQLVDTFGKGLPALVEAALTQLETDWRARFKADILKSLRENPGITPFTRLVLSLPVPENTPPLSGATQLTGVSVKQFAEHMDSALMLGTISFVERVLDNGLDEATLTEALELGLRDAKKFLDDDIQKIDDGVFVIEKAASDALKAYRTEAETLLNQLDAAIDGEKEKLKTRLRQQVPGIVYPLLFGDTGTARELANTINALKKELANLGGRDILEVLARHLVKALNIIVRALIELAIKDLQVAAGAEARTLCNHLAENFARTADKLLPPADTGTSLRTLLKAVDDLANDLSVDTKDSPVNAIARYGQIRAHLTDGIVNDFCSSDDPKSALSAIVVKEVRELNALRDEIGVFVRNVAARAEAKMVAESKEIEGKVVNDLIDPLLVFAGMATDEAVNALTSLHDAIPNVTAPATALDRAIEAQLKELRKSIVDIRETLKAVKGMLEFAKVDPDQTATDVLNKLTVVLNGAKKAQEDRFKTSRDALAEEFKGQVEALENGIFDAIMVVENRLMELFGQALAARDAATSAVIAAVGRVAAPVFTLIREQIYDRADDLRKKGKAALAQGDTASTIEKVLQILLRNLRGTDGQPLGELFAVRPIIDATKDGLNLDIELLKRLETPPYNATSYVTDLTTFVEGWDQGKASPLILLRNLNRVLTAVLRGDLAQFVDLHQIRREIDAAIRTMVPARISRSFDMKLRLGNIPNLLRFDKPSRPHPNGLPQTLVLRATGIVDVLQPKNSSFEARGFLPGFSLQLLPSFDVVTFSFPPTTFVGGSGRPFSISLKVDGVALGEKVQFLKQIESILPAPKNGKGFFIRMMTGRGGLGIVAGYILPISPITIGNMFIDNLSLNAAAELPFDKGDARFVISVSRPESPFMIAVAPYSGAGHFGLIANPKGIVGFEASFQYGGGGGFSFGPLTGKGRISVGIFIRKISGFTELYGLFYAGGSARIACFALGAQLNVRMSQTGGNVEGEAIFTYSFSIGIKDIEFSVTVFKREQGSGSGGDAGGDQHTDVMEGKTVDLAASEFRRVSDPRMAFASTERRPRLSNATRCKADNFAIYRGYFAKPEDIASGSPPPVKNTKSKKPENYAPSKPSTTAPDIWILS